MPTEQTHAPSGGFQALPSGGWAIEASRSEIGFAVKTFGLVTVRGVFDEFAGSLAVSEAGTTGGLTIQAASVNTRNNRRDKHLRSADFFDVARHPVIRFLTTAVTAGEAGLTITGDLDVGSSQASLEIPVTATRLDDGALRIVGDITVSRRAFGLTWNWLGTVSDNAALHAALTLAKRQP